MMFTDFNHEPRNWKWMVPAVFVMPLVILGYEASEYWQWGAWALVPLAMAVILFMASAFNCWAWLARHYADVYSDRMSAANATPEVRMFEAAKGMHPDAVNGLLLHRRTIWRIKYVPLKDVTDWILDEIPTVHAGFVDFVLDHSNGTLMSKRLLSDGSKQFDPEGLVTDYQQYDDLVRYMQQKLMITQALGNQSPKFLPPWDMDLIRHRFGLDGEGYGVDDDMSDALKAVVRAQAVSSQNTNSAKPNASVPDVISQALDGLEQTSQMKAQTAQLFKSRS